MKSGGMPNGTTLNEQTWADLADQLDQLRAVQPLRVDWHAYVGSEDYGIWILRPEGAQTDASRAKFSLIAAQAIEKLGIPPIPVPEPLQHCPHWVQSCQAEEGMARRAGKLIDLSTAVPYGLAQIDADAVDPCTRAWLEQLRRNTRTVRISEGWELILGKQYQTLSGTIDDLLSVSAAYCRRRGRDEIGARLTGITISHGTAISDAAGDRSLTPEQQGLLRAIVSEYRARQGSPFIFVKSQSGAALCYPGGQSLPVIADESDFVQLRRKNLLNWTRVGKALNGKPTQKGIEFADFLQGTVTEALPAERISRPRVGDDSPKYPRQAADGDGAPAHAPPQSRQTAPEPAFKPQYQPKTPSLNVRLIRAWMVEEGWTNPTLADALHITERALSSMRNNGDYHGSDAVTKLANKMGRDPADLYLPPEAST